MLGGCKSEQFGNDISPAQEQQMGDKYAADIEAHEKIVSDGAINRRLLDIATPVFAQARAARPDVDFKIRMIDDSEVNAFSIPGGWVYINRGLYDRIGSDDDALACIIAHESAHIVLRHAVKQISDEQAKGMVIVFATVLTHSDTVNEVGSSIAEAYDLHFSREDEYQADRWGERFAYNAGYDPSGMLRTFLMLEKVEKEQGTVSPYESDHPITKNREIRALEQIRELRANHGQYMETDYDPNGDRAAADKNGIDYEQLVLATNVPGMDTAVEPAKGQTPTAPPAEPSPANVGSEGKH